MWHRLSHPHILKLYSACHEEKRYFVCEYASNGELTEYLKKPGNENCTLGLQYLRGLRIVHNGLKCDNSMVGLDGKAKLVDFGSSCLLSEVEIKIDLKKMGTGNWRSPEYLRQAMVRWFAKDHESACK